MSEKTELQTIQTIENAPTKKMTKPRGLASAFGLDPRAALLMAIVDSMLFGGDAITLGVLIPIGVVVGAIMGFIVYKIQRHWYYQDDHESALIKCLVAALLTAIPCPLGSLFSIPAGLLGIVKAIRRK